METVVRVAKVTIFAPAIPPIAGGAYEQARDAAGFLQLAGATMHS
jgi:hypothetical protein